MNFAYTDANADLLLSMIRFAQAKGEWNTYTSREGLDGRPIVYLHNHGPDGAGFNPLTGGRSYRIACRSIADLKACLGA